MSKAKRFWLTLAITAPFSILFFLWLKGAAPLVYDTVMLVIHIYMLYGFSRWIYEHWDD